MHTTLTTLLAAVNSKTVVCVRNYLDFTIMLSLNVQNEQPLTVEINQVQLGFNCRRQHHVVVCVYLTHITHWTVLDFHCRWFNNRC